ncbi:MAG TPA: uroporphyrinogen-III synthase [Candidatus Dormibacteraeota bacterium]|nr:uroporphyrinogen-III synthase [Candidatus Dormibacteraeota bacterium]
MANQTKQNGLAGLRVLSLESRRAAEMAKLIESYGGQAIVAPSMREVPLESNAEALDFARKLAANGFDMVIFLTGVGTKALAHVVETVYPLEQFRAALGRIAVVARGPKPVAALRELGVAVTVAVPEPNTWKDLLRVLDEKADEKAESLLLRGRSVAVQEYGSSNAELLAGLAQRGARVTRVPVYQWALPEDTGPLRAAVEAIARGEIDVALFTTSIQVVHLLRIAREMKSEEQLRGAFERIAVGSIGPVTSEELREEKLPIDFEPEHPKMGFLVNEAGRRAAEVVAHKRALSSG